jgi:hypothetical protein
MSNNRIEIRHVVGKKGKNVLLPKLKYAERRDFVSDSDIVVRDVVARELGIPLVILK